MSLAPHSTDQPWTWADLDALPDDGQRYEVVDGALLVSPPPSQFHQTVSRRLYAQLVRAATPQWEPAFEFAFFQGTDVRVPDLAVLRSGIRVRRGEIAYLPADFGLLVEVVSPTSTGMDRLLKPAEYAAAGVPFYWRVETEPVLEVVAHELTGGVYVEVARLSQGSGTLPGPFPVVVDLDELDPPDQTGSTRPARRDPPD